MRVSRSAHHAAETVAYVGQYTARNDDFQVVDRIGDGLFAASESDQDFGQVDHRDGDEYGREDKCQNESVAQNVTGPFDIFHPQYDRQPGGCSYADERADRGDQRHQREGQRKARDGQRPDPVADEDAVDHVVERRGRHGDDRRHGILHEQLPDSLGSELQSRRFYLRHKLYSLKNSITGPHVRHARPGLPHSTLCASSSRLNRAG